MKVIVNLNDNKITSISPYGEVTKDVQNWLDDNNSVIADIDNPIESKETIVSDTLDEFTEEKIIFRELTEDEIIFVQKVIVLDPFIESHMEAEAKAWGYNSVDRAITYIGGNNDEWHKEGTMFRDWRIAIWEYVQSQLSLIESGQRPFPTNEELELELPKIETYQTEQGL